MNLLLNCVSPTETSKNCIILNLSLLKTNFTTNPLGFFFWAKGKFLKKNARISPLGVPLSHGDFGFRTSKVPRWCIPGISAGWPLQPRSFNGCFTNRCIYKYMCIYNYIYIYIYICLYLFIALVFLDLFNYWLLFISDLELTFIYIWHLFPNSLDIQSYITCIIVTHQQKTWSVLLDFKPKIVGPPPPNTGK